MVTRRATLALLASALGGCFGRQDPPSEPSETPSYSPTATSYETDTGPTPDRNTPPDEWPPAEWTPDWTHTVPVSHVVGLDVVDDRLIITANDHPDTTVIQSFDPASRSVDWSRELPGGALENSMLERTMVQRNWGVTDAGGTLLAVTVSGREREWTELHALDPGTGDERWSLRRNRSLAVRGLVEETVYVVSREFEPQTTEHHHGSDTPTPEPRAARLLAVDLADGTVRWSREFTDIGAAAADADGVYVAVTNRMLGFDHDGSRRWRAEADARGKAIFAGSEVVYYVAKPEWDRSVVRGVGHDGDVRWQQRFDADESIRHGDRLWVAGDELAAVRPDGSLAFESSTFSGRMTFAPSGERAYVRTGRQADAVAAIAAADGTRQWLFDPPINNAWPEAATDEWLVAGGIDHSGQPLYRVDAASGEATARYLDQDPLVTRPMDEYVFAGTGRYEDGGQVLALPL